MRRAHAGANRVSPDDIPGRPLCIPALPAVLRRPRGGPSMDKRIFINADDPEEVRIAITVDGKLDEVYIERANAETYLGNIYKGVVTNVEPSIGARSSISAGTETGSSTPPTSCRCTATTTRSWPTRTGRTTSRSTRSGTSRNPEEEPGGSRSGDEGRDRQEGADAHDLPEHPGPVPRAHAEPVALGRLQEDRGPRGALRGSSSSSSGSTLRRHGVHHPHRRDRPERGRAPRKTSITC